MTTSVIPASSMMAANGSPNSSAAAAAGADASGNSSEVSEEPQELKEHAGVYKVRNATELTST